ncbi:MAG: rod shape-determining protein MreC [Candidatus Loosdrechtia sp.]|uniref:rod shape-determining protein MreC n=1 Tax=Candidatus Loosdrechtia sp. TaxID=3101272 RepID=UPI003A757456|nr:MAG: rod shape-determining protein MreC [Candidatus Jettenia sp. AMX2]
MKISTPNLSRFIKTPLTAILIFLATSLLMLFLPPRISNRIKMTCVVPIRPLQSAAVIGSNTAANFLHKVLSAWYDEQKKERLEEKVSEMKNKIIEQQDIIYKLQNKLNALSKFQAKVSNAVLVPADIIGYDSSNFRKSITINAGSRHGVRVNNSVVSNNALIGRIAVVNAGNSIVLLITDPASRIPGRVLQTREQVIVEGNATPFCQLKYVPRGAKMKKGDDIVTSDIGGLFPPSLPVATIIENELEEGAVFRSVKVLPKVNISEIESVLVIINEYSEKNK